MAVGWEVSEFLFLRAQMVWFFLVAVAGLFVGMPGWFFGMVVVFLAREHWLLVFFWNF